MSASLQSCTKNSLKDDLLSLVRIIKIVCPKGYILHINMIYFDSKSFSTLSSVCLWLWEKTVSESGCVSLDIPIAPTRGQQLKKVVTGM